MATNPDKKSPFEKLQALTENESAHSAQQGHNAQAHQMPPSVDQPVERTKTPRKLTANLSKVGFPLAGIAICYWLFVADEPARRSPPEQKFDVNQTTQDQKTKALLDQMARDAEARKKPLPDFTEVPVKLETAPAPKGVSDADRQAELKRIAEEKQRQEEIDAAPLVAAGNFETLNKSGAGQSEADPSDPLAILSARQKALRQQAVDMVQIPGLGGSQGGGAAMTPASASLNSAAYMDGGGADVNQDPNRSFQKEQSAASEEPNRIIRQQPAVGKFVLDEGTPIDVTLQEAITSDLPGELTARVTYDVYDSRGYGRVMIPKDSKLVGRYNNQVTAGQARMLFAMTRLIRPDGTWVPLSGANATDQIGQAGVGADVNNHFFKIFGTSLILGAASYLLPSGDRQITTTTGGFGGVQAGGSIAGQALNDTIKHTMERNKRIPPTLSIPFGTSFQFKVAHDMVLQPYAR